MNKDLEVAIENFLAFGKPCEGSFRYHDAWKKLQEAYYPIVGFKKGEIAVICSSINTGKSCYDKTGRKHDYDDTGWQPN